MSFDRVITDYHAKRVITKNPAENATTECPTKRMIIKCPAEKEKKGNHKMFCLKDNHLFRLSGKKGRALNGMFKR